MHAFLLSLAIGLAGVILTAQSPATQARSPQAAASSPASKGAMTPAIESLLREIRTVDKGQLAVSEEDGRFLRLMVATRGAKSILEIGGASGYSGIWLGLGARETGGRVVSIEYDAQRAKEGAANIRRAGLEDVVRVIQGDAFAEIPKLQGTFDLVFLDAWKPDYKKFFEMVYPRLVPGGVFMAHNVVNKRRDMEPFLQTILGHPGLFTSIVSPGSEGMSLSYKVR